MLRDREYRERWASRFDCVLADEYQDINHAQYVWLRSLRPAHGRLFVVGDDSQSMYSWRGSDITYIRRFTRDFPHAAQVALEDNFRSYRPHPRGGQRGHRARHQPAGEDAPHHQARGRSDRGGGVPQRRGGSAGIVGEIRRRAAEGMPVAGHGRALPLELHVARAGGGADARQGPLRHHRRRWLLSARRESRMPWRCCAWCSTPTARNPTRRSGGCATRRRAGSGPRPWQPWRQRLSSAALRCLRRGDGDAAAQGAGGDAGLRGRDPRCRPRRRAQRR